jgi:hypothetical protein
MLAKVIICNLYKLNILDFVFEIIRIILYGTVKYSVTHLSPKTIYLFTERTISIHIISFMCRRKKKELLEISRKLKKRLMKGR